MTSIGFLALVILLCPLSLLFILLAIIVQPRAVKVPIKGRHVFITGGSSGIGLALAHQVASEGGLVTILARNLDRLDEAKRSIRLSTGMDIAIYSVDVRDYEAVKRAMGEAGPIDILVCNHGVFLPSEVENLDLEEAKFTIDVNLMGTINLIKAALPGMKKNRNHRGPASIAITSSMGGQVGMYGYVAYTASKFGLRGLAESLQQEVISDNIHVTLIHPPDTDTPGLREERKRRPELTDIILASPVLKADEVAKKALDGIKSASFIVPCNFEGLMLSIGTAGISPQRSILMAFIEVVAAGIVRFVNLIVIAKSYRSIAKWHALNKQQVDQPTSRGKNVLL